MSFSAEFQYVVSGTIILAFATGLYADRTVNFENRSVGQYTGSMMAGDWGASWNNGLDEGRAKVVASTNGKSLEVRYPAGKYGPADGGVQFKSPTSLSDEMYAEYKVMFKDGFNFVKGGKLPGLCGGDCSSGGTKPSGTDGWSARYMWRTGGKLSLYLYHMDQPSDYGEDFYLKAGTFVVKPNTWYTLKQYIKLNTQGKSDGVARVWVDGTEMLSLSNLRFRTNTSLKVSNFFFSTFFGGDDGSWAPASDQFTYFDDFKISVTGSSGNVTPPVDSSGFLLDDFEDGNNRTRLDGFWYTFDDSTGGGKSQVTLSFATGHSSTVSAKCAYSLNKGTLTTDPYIAIGAYTKADKTPLDISAATGISFWYKGGTNKSVLRVETPAVAATTKKAYHRVGIVPASNWTYFQAKWSDFVQPAWTGVVPQELDLKTVLKLTWQIIGDRTSTTTETGEFWLDNVRFPGLTLATGARVGTRAIVSAGDLAMKVDGSHIYLGNGRVGESLEIAIYDLSGNLLREWSHSDATSSTMSFDTGDLLKTAASRVIRANWGGVPLVRVIRISK